MRRRNYEFHANFFENTMVGGNLLYIFAISCLEIFCKRMEIGNLITLTRFWSITIVLRRF